MVKSLSKSSDSGVNGCQIVKCHFLLLAAPGCLVKGVVALFVSLLIKVRQPQQVEGFPIIRVGVSLCQTLQSFSEIFFRPLEIPPAHQERAVGIVDPDVPRVSFQPLQIVGIGKISGMAVLLDMLPGEIQLLVCHNLLRRLCRSGRFGKLRDFCCLALVFHQEIFLGITDPDPQIFLLLSGDFHIPLINICRGKPYPLIQNRLAANCQLHSGRLVYSRGIDDHMGCIPFHGKMDGGLGGGIFYLSHRFIGHEILGKGFFLKGFQPGKIRLVIRVYPCHQFHIRAVLIGQVPVPGPAEITAAPGPLLLAR